MSEKKKKKDANPNWSEANTELEEILGEIDLDALTDKVERAAALLAICRQKLAATETKVKKVVAEMSAPEDEKTDEDAQ